MIRQPKRQHAEQGFQTGLCQLLDLHGLLFVAVPNEGKRSAVAGAKMKDAGLRPGFPDGMIFDVRGSDRGLLCLVENKSSKGELRTEQTDWVEEMALRGVRVFGPWRTYEDAQRDLASIGVRIRL